jgi:hypothetical protein
MIYKLGATNLTIDEYPDDCDGEEGVLRNYKILLI